LAETVTRPETVAPEMGEVIETVGGVVSPGPPLTDTFTSVRSEKDSPYDRLSSDTLSMAVSETLGAVTDHERVTLCDGARFPNLCNSPPLQPDGKLNVPSTEKASRSPLFLAVQSIRKISFGATSNGPLQFMVREGPPAGEKLPDEAARANGSRPLPRVVEAKSTFITTEVEVVEETFSTF
jgi:hypothetical protein